MNIVERTVAEIEAQNRENAQELGEFWANPDMIRNEELKDILTTLTSVSYQIAELSRIKEELEKRVNALLEHSDDGSKTYVVGKFKVTVSSGYNYTLNKEEYEILASRLSPCFNPVKMKQSYELDKKIIRDCEAYGSKDDVLLLSEIISKKPKKLAVRISAGI